MDELSKIKEPLINLEFSNLENSNQNSKNSSNIQSLSYGSDTSGDSKKNSYNTEPIFFRDADALRHSYYDKIKMKFRCIENPFKRDYNSIILFDWDDTLFCSSYLTKKKVLLNKKSMEDLGPKFKEKILKVEAQVLNILKISISFGDTFIITNATRLWVEFSCSLIYPSVLEVLSKVNIISARDNYERIFPNQPKKWKLQTFKDLTKGYNRNIVTNIICIGDSEGEAEAGVEMSNLFRESYLKIIKFREDPKPEHISKQLSLVESQFFTLHAAVRNISIHVENRKK